MPNEQTSFNEALKAEFPFIRRSEKGDTVILTSLLYANAT